MHTQECVLFIHVSVKATMLNLLDEMKSPIISQLERIERAFINAIEQVSRMGVEQTFVKLVLFTLDFNFFLNVHFD